MNPLFTVGKRYSVTFEGEAIDGHRIKVTTNEPGQGVRQHILGGAYATSIPDAYRITQLADPIPPAPMEGTLFKIELLPGGQTWNGHVNPRSPFFVEYRKNSYSSEPQLWSVTISPTWRSWDNFHTQKNYKIVAIYAPSVPHAYL